MENELTPSGNNLLASELTEAIALSPGELADFPDGLAALSGNDTITGSLGSEVIMGNRDEDSLIGGGGTILWWVEKGMIREKVAMVFSSWRS